MRLGNLYFALAFLCGFVGLLLVIVSLVGVVDRRVLRRPFLAAIIGCLLLCLFLFLLSAGLERVG
jgi:hypothetical protein